MRALTSVSCRSCSWLLASFSALFFFVAIGSVAQAVAEERKGGEHKHERSGRQPHELLHTTRPGLNKGWRRRCGGWCCTSGKRAAQVQHIRTLCCVLRRATVRERDTRPHVADPRHRHTQQHLTIIIAIVSLPASASLSSSEPRSASCNTM
jgi:hypothetical protein